LGSFSYLDVSVLLLHAMIKSKEKIRGRAYFIIL
jgi:hypothetical protein